MINKGWRVGSNLNFYINLYIAEKKIIECDKLQKQFLKINK